jgi:hypothetical protein
MTNWYVVTINFPEAPKRAELEELIQFAARYEGANLQQDRAGTYC